MHDLSNKMPIPVTYQQYSTYSYVLRGDLDAYRDALTDTGNLDCTFNELLKGGPGWIVRARNKQLVAKWLENEPGIQVVENADNPELVCTSKPDLDLHQVMRQLNQMQQSMASLETLILTHLREQGQHPPEDAPKSTSTVRRILRKPQNPTPESTPQVRPSPLEKPDRTERLLRSATSEESK